MDLTPCSEGLWWIGCRLLRSEGYRKWRGSDQALRETNLNLSIHLLCLKQTLRKSNRWNYVRKANNLTTRIRQQYWNTHTWPLCRHSTYSSQGYRHLIMDQHLHGNWSQKVNLRSFHREERYVANANLDDSALSWMKPCKHDQKFNTKTHCQSIGHGPLSKPPLPNPTFVEATSKITHKNMHVHTHLIHTQVILHTRTFLPYC